MSPLGVTNKRQSALIGFLVGEMVGVPFDSVRLEFLPGMNGSLLPLAEDFPRGHKRAPQGAWADGGAQVLALLDSLAACTTLDLEDLAERLMAWLARGEYCVEGVVFEYGLQTTRALAAFRDGVPASQSGPKGERNNGNGALMRVLPLALWWRGRDETELVTLARRSCLPTHGHVLSQLCAALYCLWVHHSLLSAGDQWDAAVASLRHTHLSIEDEKWLARILEAEHAPHENNRFVLNTLWAVRDAWKAGADWQQRVRAAINLGNDTDTAAALVGGVSAASEGIEAIPAEWLEMLPEHEKLTLALHVLESIEAVH